MIADKEVETLTEMFKLLGDVSRLRIILCCLDRPVSVGEIVEQVGISQSLVSHHLRLLRATRLLKSVKDGRQVFYSLPDCHVRDMLTNLIDHIMEPHGQDAPGIGESNGRDDGEVRLR